MTVLLLQVERHPVDLLILVLVGGGHRTCPCGHGFLIVISVDLFLGQSLCFVLREQILILT